MIKLDCCFTTDVGNIRKNNEDNFYLNGAYKRALDDISYSHNDFIYRGGIFAVCDGMGGEEYGEKASFIAVETLKAYQSKNFNETVSEYIDDANKKICDLINENNGTRSGTTLALIYIDEDNKATIYNIGDSRVYLYRKGKLNQVSEDHTQVARMVKMGALTKEQASTHKDRHILTQHLGIFPDELIVQPYKCDIGEIIHDDIFLLCSDGLTDMISDSEIECILKNDYSSLEYSESLKNAALNKGGKDNVTVGVIKVIGKKRKFTDRIWGIK